MQRSQSFKNLSTEVGKDADVVVFGSFSNSTGESILNSLKTVGLGDVYVQEKRSAVV